MNYNRRGNIIESYRFGFNGQEKDDEVFGSTGTSLNYKFRMYDSRTGRFFSVDPITSDYPMLTPYQHSSLNPIWLIELEGLEGRIYIDTKNVGHVFISVVDDNDVLHVYTMGQYGEGKPNSDKSSMYGKGAILHMKGKNAERYIKDEFNSEKVNISGVYEYKNIDPQKVVDYASDLFKKLPDADQTKYDYVDEAVKTKYGGVIIPFTGQNNCVTTSLFLLDKGVKEGSQYYFFTEVPLLIKSQIEWQLIGQKLLGTDDVKDITEEVKSEYENE